MVGHPYRDPARADTFSGLRHFESCLTSQSVRDHLFAHVVRSHSLCRKACGSSSPNQSITYGPSSVPAPVPPADGVLRWEYGISVREPPSAAAQFSMFRTQPNGKDRRWAWKKTKRTQFPAPVEPNPVEFLHSTTLSWITRKTSDTM